MKLSKIHDSMLLCLLWAGLLLAPAGCKEDQAKPGADTSSAATSAAPAASSGAPGGGDSGLTPTGIPECDKYLAKQIECNPGLKGSPEIAKLHQDYTSNAKTAYKEQTKEGCLTGMAALQNCGGATPAPTAQPSAAPSAKASK